MEYGLRISTLENAFKSPVEFSDKATWDLCSDARLAALYFGSEFCQELIPATSIAEAFCAHCAERGLEAVLLTPLVTHKGLTRLSRLLDDLASKDWFPAVVFNDWGVFELLQTSHPSLSRRMGRLMNRGLRDPRLEMQVARPAGENTGRGAGLRKFASSLEITALESDADLEPGFLGGGGDGLNRTLHLPFTFVASGRNCLEKAAARPAHKGLFTHGLSSGCHAPCRGIYRQEYRQDTCKQMWRAGNTLFFKPPTEWVARHIALADRVVFHESPMP